MIKFSQKNFKAKKKLKYLIQAELTVLNCIKMIEWINIRKI